MGLGKFEEVEVHKRVMEKGVRERRSGVGGDGLGWENLRKCGKEREKNRWLKKWEKGGKE